MLGERKNQHIIENENVASNRELSKVKTLQVIKMDKVDNYECTVH